MPNTDATVLSELKTARDAIITALASGTSTVSYTIRNRTHQMEPSSQLLRTIEDMIQTYERKSSSSSPYRLAKLSRPTRQDS